MNEDPAASTSSAFVSFLYAFSSWIYSQDAYQDTWICLFLDIIGVLEFEVLYDDGFEMPENILVTLEVKLGYHNKGGADDD